MLEEAARIVQLNGDHAWVETRTQVGCQRCAAGRGCGAGTLSQALAKSAPSLVKVRLASPLSAQRLTVGDVILVGLDERAVVSGSVALYLWPLLGMIFAALLASRLAASELPIIAAAAAGLAFGLWLVRQYSRRAERDPRYEPVANQQLAASAWHGCDR